MLKSYLIISFRNLLKHKLYSFINIFGLAIGLAGCIAILVFITDELSYDKYHKNAGNIYRVVTDLYVGGVNNNIAVTSFPMASALKKDFPEVKESARLISWSQPIISFGENKYKEKNFLWGDNSLFSIFDFKFVRGNPNTALNNPNEVIITQSTALKYFGNDDPLGKVLVHDNQVELKVTGVIKDIPGNSHFNFDLLGSYPTLEAMIGKDYTGSWHSFFKIYTYVLLPRHYNYRQFESKLPGFVKTYMQDDIAKSLGRTYTLSVQPLTSIHLNSTRRADIGTNGSMEQVYIFSIIAVFILLIACINFTNLSTARSIKRSMEVGLRKVLGAQRKQLILQFIGESFLSSLAAIPIALVIAELAMPVLNSLSGKNLQINFFSDYKYIAAGITFVFLISLAAGTYPAFFLSKFKPVLIMKKGSNIASGKSSYFIRRGLIILQFSISIILIICTAIVFNQLDYIKNKKLGIDNNGIVVLPVTDVSIRQKYDVFKNALIQNNLIENVTSSSYLPGKALINTPFKKQAASDNEKYELATLPVDYNFFNTLGIKIIAGRGYSKDITSDTVDAFIINETAAKQFGWKPDEAIGKKLDWDGAGPLTGTIIGVSNDFNFQSLHNAITPLVFVPVNLWPLPSGFISIKVRPESITSLIPFLKKEWEKMFTGIPFEYTFLDEDFASYYSKEEKTGKIFTIFASLAIFIACLGLFGLSAYSVETKTKEIGIRKVLGSSVTGIVKLLSKEFIILVTAANIVAVPVSYYFMQGWLDDFAYRVDIGISVFIAAAVIALLIALITVSYHSIKAANTNPVKALKYE